MVKKDEGLSVLSPVVSEAWPVVCPGTETWDGVWEVVGKRRTAVSCEVANSESISEVGMEKEG